MSEIGQLNIGSRPSHRQQQDRSKQSVRAIAWVFAWAQSRQTFPAWYGIGSSISTWCAGKLERRQKLQMMYRDWPFFRDLLSNVQMALSKSDINITKEYAELCVSPATGKRIYGLVAEEYQFHISIAFDPSSLLDNHTTAAFLTNLSQLNTN